MTGFDMPGVAILHNLLNHLPVTGGLVLMFRIKEKCLLQAAIKI